MVSVLSEFVLSVLLYFYFFPGEGNHANCLLLHFFFTYFFTCKGSIYLYFKYQGCFYWCSKTLEAFLSVPEEKQVPAIFMALTGKIREAILKRILKNYWKKVVDNLTVELNKTNLKDEIIRHVRLMKPVRKFLLKKGKNLQGLEVWTYLDML